ncbi:uncharacterized protein LOC117152548 [Bombus impatiens]|uniref:Uncharacterized protein LOC117152548 n=1 Tax=Bombus impatiens TaxID=132113 RepID=A0A6P8LN40_BOMIM|nr:uncharacterized protein LOC117152548 [Bombus impatiens]
MIQLWLAQPSPLQLLGAVRCILTEPPLFRKRREGSTSDRLDCVTVLCCGTKKKKRRQTPTLEVKKERYAQTVEQHEPRNKRIDGKMDSGVKWKRPGMHRRKKEWNALAKCRNGGYRRSSTPPSTS